jgi:hypothetical protein
VCNAHGYITFKSRADELRARGRWKCLKEKYTSLISGPAFHAESNPEMILFLQRKIGRGRTELWVFSPSFNTKMRTRGLDTLYGGVGRGFSTLRFKLTVTSGTLTFRHVISFLKARQNVLDRQSVTGSKPAQIAPLFFFFFFFFQFCVPGTLIVHYD